MKWAAPPLLVLAACAISPRDDAPDLTAPTALTAEQAVGCLVRELDAAFPGPAFLGGIGHHGVLIVPGEVYEVEPTRDLIIGGESYFVRVTTVDTGATMQIYAAANWVPNLGPAVTACAERSP